MSDNIEYTFEASSASQGDDFFDFAAASGEYDDSGPSNAAQTWATPNSPWTEGWHDFSMANINYGTPLESSMQTSAGFAMENSYPAGMDAAPHHYQPVSYTSASYDAPYESNIWGSGSNISQYSAVPCDMSALMEPHDNLQPDPLTGSSSGHMDNQRIEGSSSMVGWAPSDGRQSE